LDLFLERDYFKKRREKQNSFQINRQKKLLLDRLHTQQWISHILRYSGKEKRESCPFRFSTIFQQILLKS
jgi:hypothetical protein